MQVAEVESGTTIAWIRSLRLAGVTLLALFALDVAETVVPVQWMDPAWELQVIGAIIERSPVPLLGLVLFFYGDAFARSKLTQWVARGLSWGALLGGLALLLTLPLIVADTARLVKRAESQVTGQLQEQLTQSNQLEAELKVAPADALAHILTRMGRSMGDQLELEVRESLVAELRQNRAAAETRARAVLEEQKFALMKRSWKWGAQALLLGCTLLYVWRQSGWIRLRAQAA